MCQGKSNLIFLIIIFCCLSASVTFVNAQDLDLVIPEKNAISSTRSTKVDSSGGSLSGDIFTKVDLQRQEHTYRKEAYLSEVLRRSYYQRITSPTWMKYLNPEAWQINVLKWRYWSQLKNYVTSNNEEILVLRTELPPEETQGPIIDSMPQEEVDSVQLVNIDSIIEQVSDFSLLEIDTGEVSNDEDLPTVDMDEVEYVNATSKSDLESNQTEPILQEAEIVIEDPAAASQEEGKEIEESSKKVVIEEKRPVVREPVAKKTPRSPSRIFRDQKGILPWPINQGAITDRFGLRKNAEARGLRRENYGIDMKAPGGTLVRAVHDGAVLMAVFQPPYDNIVTIKHGDYTSAYYFLANSNVRVGDSIKKGQIIGNLKRNVDQADFHFEIWDNQSRVNPEVWLQKK